MPRIAITRHFTIFPFYFQPFAGRTRSKDISRPVKLKSKRGYGPLRTAFISPQFVPRLTSTVHFLESGFPLPISVARAHGLGCRMVKTALRLLTVSAGGQQNGRGSSSRSGGWEFRRSVHTSEGSVRGLIPNDECGSPPEAVIHSATRSGYFLEPRRGFRNCDWRILIFFRLGLLITKVPLPRYSALKSLSSAIIDPSLYRALS